ncbi:MAG: hypothetical protein M3214_05855, partial [Actinomycetota bacterium]|nr:hypothetical protein [Actinomycetota bacterium]
MTALATTWSRSISRDSKSRQTGRTSSPETYLGYQQGRNFASPGGGDSDERRTYAVPDNLE